MKTRAFFEWAVVVMLAGGGPWPSRGDEPKPADAKSGEVTVDFEGLALGAVPSALMVIEGEFGIAEDAGNKVLELRAEPIVDAAVLVGPSVKEAATVQARLKAAKSRRGFPRMGVGLYGVSGVKLRLVPAQKKLELLQGDAVIGEAPLEWKEDVWWKVALAVVHTGGTWKAEARVWSDGGTRPETPQLAAPLPAPPGQGRASLLGSPYANKPVVFDDVIVTDGN